MSIAGNKQAILYVITNLINGLKYYGIIHKKDKTIEQRFEDHKQGKGGRFLHRAMQEYGADNFIIEKIEQGDLEYIRQREVEETANTLYVHNKGYNGNCGKCIILDKEMNLKKIANTDQSSRVPKWRSTYSKNRHKHDYSRDASFLEKQEKSNYSKIRGKTKHDSDRLQKLSVSNIERWKNPTEKMITGKIKSIETNKAKTEQEKQAIREKQNTARRIKREQGVYTTSPCVWYTPLKNFKTAEEGALMFGLGVSTFKTWCTQNKCIFKRYHKYNEKILSDWDGKTTTEVGFYVVRQPKHKS